MAIITEEKMQNLDTDIQHAGEAINEDKVINPRYGAPFNSFPRAVRLMMETGGWNFYSTESELLATVPEVVPSVAYAADTKKLYKWNGTSWINEGLSPLDQANKYSEALILEESKKITELRDYVDSLVIEGNEEALKSLVDELLNELIAAGAGEGGWIASLVADAGGDNQQVINDRIGNYWRDKINGYQVNDRVMLSNGDIVKCLIPNNKNNPHIDMTGWVNLNAQHLLTGAPAKAVNITKGVDAPTVVDYFDGYFWGTRSQKIERSLDGVSWEVYCNLTTSTNIMRLIPTSDNEVLALASSAQYVYKSNGWSTKNPTWKTVLTNPYPGANNPILPWGFDGYGSKFIATHYGSGVSNWANSRYVWISTDAGETFSQVWDTEEQYPGKSVDSHLHAACYDRWADRFYFAEGHGDPCGIYYSDSNGASWTKIPNMPLTPGPTVMVPTDFGIVLGTDSEPNGTVLMPREKVPDGNNFQFLGPNLPYSNNRAGVMGFADRGMRDPDTGIVYIGFNSSFADVPVVIFAVGSGGSSIILTEGYGTLEINRFSNVVAAKGKLLATHNIAGRIVADLPPYTTQAVPYDTGNFIPFVKRTVQSALAVGNHAVSTGLRSLAVGGTATGQDAVAIGYFGTTANQANSLAVGNNAKAMSNSLAVGYFAEAIANTLACGYMAKATGAESTAVGRSASAAGVYSVAFGRSTAIPVAGNYSTAIGAGSITNNAYCSALGYNANAAGDKSTAIGASSSATNGFSTAIGELANSLFSAVSVGKSAQSGNYSVAVGSSAKTGNDAIAVGYLASALLQYSIAVGDTASAGSASDTVVGRGATSASGVTAQTVLGAMASSAATQGVAIGNNAKVLTNHANSVALGAGSETERSNVVAIGGRDIESSKNGSRVILKSPNGTKYAISVSDTGVITATSI